MPPKTASPTAAFFREENPLEAELLDVQYDNAAYIWQAIIRRDDFQAAQYKVTDGRVRILSHSVRNNVDWQLSYIGSDDVPTMHSDYLEDENYDPLQGHSMAELYNELANDGARHIREVELVLQENRERGNRDMDEKISLFAADTAKMYALYNRIPISPDSEYFASAENVLGEIDRKEYQRIITDTLITEEHPLRVAVLQAQSDDLSYQSWKRVNQNNVLSSNYEIIHIYDESNLREAEPERIYTKFNEPGARPGNYYGTSISTGDIIVTEESGEFKAKYVNDIGFVDLPDTFFDDETKQKILLGIDVRQERDLLQRYTDFINANSFSFDISQELSRLNELNRDFEAVIALADMRESTHREEISITDVSAEYVQLSERIDNFLYEYDPYDYADRIGSSPEERSENRQQIAINLELGRVRDMISYFEEVRETIEENTGEDKEVNEIIQALEERYAREENIAIEAFEEREKQETENISERPEYIYYSLRRPVSIGTYPRNGMLSFENFDQRTFVEEIGREAWGRITYDRELTLQEINDFEFAVVNHPHSEEERKSNSMPKEHEMPIVDGISQPEEKKSARDMLSEQLLNGVKSVMDSDNYKNWLNTSSRMFTNNYSVNNAILIFLQKPDASYTMGYEAWKEYGRTVSQGAKGAKIFVPVMAYEKSEGALHRMIMSNLREQIKQNPDTVAVYKVGTTKCEFTMNANGQVGLRLDGNEKGIFSNQQEMRKFISNAILGKVPMYYNVGTVFDVKDTVVPEYLWVKKGYTKDEVVKNKDGKPIKNRRGEIKIINTPERQAKFRPSLDLSIQEKDPVKMGILYEALKAVSERNGVPVSDVPRESDETLKGGADGYFSRQFTAENPKGFIVMPDDLKPTNKCAVLIHEMGHSDLHGNLQKLAEQMGEKMISRQMREIQAESVAYATARQFGIETDTSSFKYLAAYAQGFELQDLKKSMDVIYKECKKLTQEISAELEVRGLNLDLSEKPLEIMDSETVNTLSKQYTAYALEMASDISGKKEELPMLAAENRGNADLLEILKHQKYCIDRLEDAIQYIHDSVSALKKADSREKQDNAITEMETAKRILTGEKELFSDLSEAFSEVSARSKESLKEAFFNNPLSTLESMKKEYSKLETLSSLQLSYIAKSEYIKREYGNLLKTNPDKFVDSVSERAEALNKVISKNGAFVEVNFCEQWTDKPIVQDGTLMHPKVADSIIKQAEIQIRGLKSEAEQTGDYFPYNKCALTVFTKEGTDFSAYYTRIDIGDGAQNSLSDHLEQLCGKESNLVSTFEKSTREKNSKDKIVEFSVPVDSEPPERDYVEKENGEAITQEAWEHEIETEKAEYEPQINDHEKQRTHDNKEH